MTPNADRGLGGVPVGRAGEDHPIAEPVGQTAKPLAHNDDKAVRFARLLPLGVLEPLRDVVHESRLSQCGAWSDTCGDWEVAESVLADVITALWTSGYHLCLEGEAVRDGRVIKPSPIDGSGCVQ